MITVRSIFTYVKMNGFSETLWHRSFDREITLIPGIRRNIVNENDELYGF